MGFIKLKKNLRTITANNSYYIQVLIKQKKNTKFNLGSYNQKQNMIVLDLKTFIFWIKKGASISGNLKKIMKKTTNEFQSNKKKTINCKY